MNFLAIILIALVILFIVQAIQYYAASNHFYMSRKENFQYRDQMNKDKNFYEKEFSSAMQSLNRDREDFEIKKSMTKFSIKKPNKRVDKK